MDFSWDVTTSDICEGYIQRAMETPVWFPEDPGPRGMMMVLSTSVLRRVQSPQRRMSSVPLSKNGIRVIVVLPSRPSQT